MKKVRKSPYCKIEILSPSTFACSFTLYNCVLWWILQIDRSGGHALRLQGADWERGGLMLDVLAVVSSMAWDCWQETDATGVREGHPPEGLPKPEGSVQGVWLSEHALPEEQQQGGRLHFSL